MSAFWPYLSHPIVAIVLLLGILVLVHETGHFLIGKLCGIGVEVFSIGFGPVIFRVAKGETEYRLSIVPLGGFVKFYGSVSGESVPESMKGREYCKAGILKRCATIFAGPFANFLLAIFCYFSMALHGIEHPPALVGEILADSPAESAGLVFGDLITHIDGAEVKTWQNLHDIVSDAPGVPLKFEVINNDQRRTVDVTPERAEDDLLPGVSRGRIGISPGRVPSIVTILDEESPAALSGLSTGDRIRSVYGDSGKVAVRYWREFEKLVQQGIDRGVTHLRLGVTSETKKDEQIIDLYVEGLRREDLGFTHSQLTIKSLGEFPDQKKLKVGDQIVRYNGDDVDNIFSYAKMAGLYRNPSVSVTVRREGKLLDLNLTLKPVPVQRAEGKVTLYVIPAEFMGEMVQPDPIIEQYGFIGAFGYGFNQTVRQTKVVALAVARLFTGEMPLAALGGPISIAKVASDSVKLGWMTFLSSMALISINLGLLNLLPIPVLDGGQLVLLGLEGLRGGPLPRSAIENFQKVGFVAVLSLVVVATYNDFSRFWTDMLQGLEGFFHGP